MTDSGVKQRPSSKARNWHVPVVIGALLVLWLLIFRNFIWGGDTLLYKDIGSDSINVSYPYYITLSDYLHEKGIPSWTFRTGMGQNLFPYIGTVLVSPVVWLGKGMIAQSIVYQHLVYVLVAGILFARFLADRGLTFAACLLGSLLLSFSAYMCMGSCWFFHATELVCFTGLLFAAEKAAGRGHWAYLALGVALTAFLGAFNLYLAALFLCLYVPARLLERGSESIRRLVRPCVVLAVVAFLGVALSAIISVNNFYALLNSPRGSGSASLTGKLMSSSVLGLESSLHYVTALLRPFGNDLLGTGSSFHGWQNYLEAPMSYCGIICLVLLPQVFVGASRRQRGIYAGLLLFLVIPTVFPWFRHLFWAFQGNYYRAYSLFSVFGVITLAMTAFSRYAEGRVFNLWLLGITAAVLAGILYLPVDLMQNLIDRPLRVWALVMIAAHAAVLGGGYLLRRQRLGAWIVILLATGELYYFDRITVVDDRPVITKQELTERVGYNDETVDVIRDLKATDESFYRVTKTFLSGLGVFGSVNDAMVFGFFGTSSYSSFNNLDYTNFLLALDVIDPEIIGTDTRWSLGLLGHPLLSTFACEKYVLTEDPVPFQTAEGYEFVKNYGRRYLFRNRLFLPLGLTFRQYIPEDQFIQLESEAKAATLLHAVVLSNDVALTAGGLTRLEVSDLKEQIRGTATVDLVELRRRSSLEMRQFSENRIKGNVRLEGKSVLVVQTAFDRGWHAWQDGRAVPVSKVDAGLVGVVLDGGIHEIELCYTPPFRIVGGVISLVALAILGMAVYRWPRMQMDSVR